MADLFDYNTSPLNIGLKIIIPVLFFASLILYASVRRYFTDRIRSCIDMLLWFTVFVTLAMIFRYFGDGTDFGFSKALSLKWFQSLALVIGAAFFLLAGYRLKNLFGGE